MVMDENMKVSCNEKDVIGSLGITNAIQLERRIKKELEEQGLLDPDDPSQVIYLLSFPFVMRCTYQAHVIEQGCLLQSFIQ